MTTSRRLAPLPLLASLLRTTRRLTSSRFSPSGKSLPSSPLVLTTSRRLAPLPLLLIGLTVLAVLVLSPPVVQAQGQTPDQNAVVWSADMFVVEYTSISIGAASADLFSNIGGTGDLEIRALWSHVPSRDIRLAFQKGIPDADDLTLIVGDLMLEFPPGSSGNSSFKWIDVDVDWEDGQTISVSIVLTSALQTPAANTQATGVPTISGTAQVDETLTAETSSIADEDGLDGASYSYQWTRSDGSTYADLAGATDSTYTLIFADQGKTIKVRVSFNDDADNEETLTSEATGVVAAKPNSPPTGLPTIGGTPQVGETLTADTSGIADEDGLDNAEFSYQWVSNDGNTDTDIQGATNSTYTLTDAAAGKAIKVKVSFTDDADHQETLTSAVTAAVAAKPNSPATGLPVISGTAQVGETLTAETSSIADEDGLDNATYSYQWLADDANIQGATNSTYTLVSADQGKAIKIKVSFNDDADHQETLTSAVTAAVAAKPNSPATGLPVIRGTAQVGETLTADTSGIADEDGLDNAEFSYQWVSNDGNTDTDIQGATNSTYTLVSADQGKAIKVKVSFTDDADHQETLTSAVTAAVAAKPNSPATGLPVISGTAQVGETLTAKPTGLTAQSVSHNSVTLAWDDPEDSSITGYQVLRRPLDLDEYGDGLGSAEFVAVVDDTGTSATTYTDTSVAARTRYVYRVKAWNAQGLGGASNDADAETAEDPDSQRVQPCQEGYVAPTPTEVPVTAVPIVVESTTADYFVLYASHDVGGTTVEYPVRVVLGEDGTTTLSENVAPLPKDRYRVQKYSIEEPADVDGDCTDDITELGNLGPMNPVNAAPSIDLSDGVVALPDRETFEKLAYPDSGGTWHIKFVILDNDTDRPRVYFQNTRNALHHGPFLDSIGVDWRQEDAVSGIVILDPGLLAQDGSSGVYRFQSRRSYGGTYSFFERAYTLLAANVPFLADNLALWIRSEMLSSIQSDLPLYRSSRMNLVFDEDVYGDIDYMALNPGEGYGMLRSLDPDERPHSRDIVIYETLPNELPRVAGVMSTVPQTPLSHVNLRALQNGIPNAYIADALGDETISGLIDSHVYYAVTDTGYSIRAATQEEVDEHYASSRPAETQTPQRDLTVTSITPLSNIDFDDWDSFGVKAANVAVLRTLGFPEGTVPDGFAVPFYFYDEFMKHNNLYDYIEEMLADTDFQTDYDTKADKLKKLRKKIKKADTPDWIETALTEMHATFPEGTSLRYRSSTNNEDLPNFNGAGLYDSKTQRPEETEEDGISKSLKQVYASLWNFRAFVERDFHRIDHMAAAMGVLVHPNYSDEKVNGVAVSTDPAYGTKGTYYANSQVGEDLVTNPEAHSVPEEVLLNSDGTYSVVGLSNKVSQGQLLMTDEQLGQLRQHLAQIHEKFDVLYGVEDGERFAIEIEFKIASDNILAIKQARPWVFTDPPPETGNKPHEVTGDALTAWLVTKPETHDGHPFIVHVRFSDSIDIVASDFRRRAAVVTGGRVTRVWRIDHRRDFWGIQVTPDSHSSNATLALAPNRPCTIGGAICTFDGRRLSNRLEHTVATAVVVASPNIPATGTPSISGTAQVGETLTADTSAIADQNGLDATEFSYQWLADSADIQGATGNTYTLVAADVGKTITVLVSFTDDGGNEERLTSAATAAVAYVDGPPGAPREVKVQAGDTELLVSWLPPAEENKAPVAQYRILYREEGGSNQELHTSHLSQEIGNLTNGVTYRVQVTAKNAAGYGTPSDEMSGTPDTLPPWSADMLVVEYTSVSIGAGSPDLFSYVRGSADLRIKSLWSHIPDRDLRLSFEDGVPDASDYTLQVGDLTLEFPEGSSGESSFKWTDVDVDWRDGETISVSIVLTSAPVEPAVNTPAMGAPTISGTTQVDETLRAETLSITDEDGLTNVSYSYQWIRSDNGADTDIAGETDSTYTLVLADLGKTIKVQVTFTDDGGNDETLTSEATVAATATVPSAPQNLTVTSGSQTRELDVSWQAPSSNGGSAVTGYKVQWKESTDGWDTAADVSEAAETGTTHTITSLTGGVEYAVRVIATNVVGDGPASTEARATPAGSPTSGEEGTETVESDSTAAWTATLTVGVSGSGSEAVWGYNWFLDGMGTLDKRTYNEGDQTIEVMAILLSNGFVAFNIRPHPSVDFVLTVDGTEFASADASEVRSQTLISYVWATTLDWAEDDRVALSLILKDTDSTEQSEPAENTPATGLPTIRGTPQAGQTLTADTADIADEDGLTNVYYSYQWTRNEGNSDSDIPNATDTTYTMDADDVGKTVKVRVTFTDDANNEETLTSAATEVVQRGSNAWSATMTVGARDGYTGYSHWGDPGVGSLSETKVEWDGKTHYVRYISLKDGELWLGLNEEMLSTGFVLSVGDEEFGSADAMVDKGGASYRFRWDDPGLGWSDGNEVSVNLVQSDQNTPALGPPTITGTAQVDETLTADTTGVEDADGLTNVSYTYQWIAGDSDIDGATGSSYELMSSEQGQTIQVWVTFTDDRDNAETLTSAATVAVVAAPNREATGLPTISGTPRVDETLTADTSGIADEDGLDNVSYSHQWIRSDGDTDTEIAGETSSTYTVADDDAGKHVKVRVAFIDDAGNEESLTSGTTEVLLDYDADNDGLIEVTTLKQLDAIRHDLDGDGIPTDDGVAAYTAAFPAPVERMGCSGADGCAGYEVMADLDFDTNGSGGDDAGDTYWNDGAGWTPIGGGASEISSTGWTMHNPFIAIFEGNGRTISNLFVDKRGSFLGLFGYVGFDAASGAVGVIRNVNLIDVNVTGGHDGSGLAAVNLGVITNSQVTGLVTGVNIIGGLVGENYGVIAGSHVAGCVSGGTMVGGLVGRSYGAITNSSVTGCVSGLSYVGGLVGNNYGLITGSHTAGRVSGHGVVIGGLVGSHKGAITASRSTARVLGTDSGPQSNIIGGLVGDNRGAIAASYATGHVSGEGWVGGLVGQSASAAESPSAITASYATGRVSGTRKIGGLVGVNDGTITASYAPGRYRGVKMSAVWPEPAGAPSPPATGTRVPRVTRLGVMA